MIELNASIDLKFKEELAARTTVAGKKSMYRAINTALQKGKSALENSKTGIPLIYKISKKDITPNAKLVKCYEGDLGKGKIVYSSRRLTVGTSTHFSITPKQYKSQKGVKIARRSKATATIKKSNKASLNHAFIANPTAIKGGNTMLWVREQNGKGIAPLRTISIPQMVQNPKVYNNAQEVMEKTFNDNFEKNMQKYAK